MSEYNHYSIQYFLTEDYFMKKQITATFILLSVLFALAGPVAAVEFPGRQEEKYKALKTIEIDELRKNFLEHNVVIIDVRSKLEYDTIHIKDALHLPLSGKSFSDELLNIAADKQGKKIAFY